MARLPLLLLALCSCVPAQTTYDVVIRGGRVIDPASGLDAIRDIGIRGGSIAAVSEEPLTGKVTLGAAGRVVAPGFIDLHQHGQSPENYRALIHDGVTTALELEIGVENVAKWYAERQGNALVNFGASVSHPYARNIAMTGSNPGLQGEAAAEKISAEELEKLEKLLQKGLDEGALAIGFGIAYTPGATVEELTAAFRVAAENNATCHIHMRTDRETFANLEEVLEAAEASGASVHIVHINSSGQDRAPQYLERIREAQGRGIDITTETYPYNRGSTLIESHLFDDWETYDDEEFSQYTWVESGESLTRESFEKYRKTGGTLITPPAYSEETVTKLVAHPLTMIASDGMWIDNGRAHPRSFGTFSRVLGHYVREKGVLSLTEALAKMTIRPAERLVARSPMMAKKGRIEVGADADLVVFDPETVLDRATYEDPAQYSAGIDHVVVNGVVTLREGELVEGAAAGRAVQGQAKN